MVQPLSVPASELEVTPDWLKSALSGAYPEATFKDLRCQRIGENFGFASRIFRFHWRDAGEQDRSVVIKFWNPQETSGTGELQFFKAFPRVGPRVPACFHGGQDDEAERAVLVLEDFQSAEQGDCLKPVSLDRARNLAQSLALLHGTWLESQNLLQHAWIEDQSDWDPGISWFESRRTLLLERFGERFHSFSRRVLTNLELAPGVVRSRLANAPVTLLHGDFHLDNILFEGEEPVLLDWSRVLRGPGVFNLADLVFEMTSLKHVDEILEAYLQEFNRLANQKVDLRTLEKQLGGAFLRKFTVSTCGIARWEPKLPRGVAIAERTMTMACDCLEAWRNRDPELFSFAD